jgi:hypothetical protein
MNRPRHCRPQEWHGHLHQQPKSGITGNTYTAAAPQECLRPLLPRQRDRSKYREATPSEDRHRNNKLKDRYNRRPQQECPSTAGVPVHHTTTSRSRGSQYRGSRQSLSPHQRNSTTDKGNGPDRKNSTSPVRPATSLQRQPRAPKPAQIQQGGRSTPTKWTK